MEKFRTLKVWQKAHVLTVAVYEVTKNFPKYEQYGLSSQMQRAAVSVPANLAEGTKRQTSKDKRHFCTMADTSLEELKYYFILGYQLGYLSVDKATSLTEKAREVGRMLHGYKQSL